MFMGIGKQFFVTAPPAPSKEGVGERSVNGSAIPQKADLDLGEQDFCKEAETEFAA